MNGNYFEMLKEVRQSYIDKWTGKHRQDPYKFGDWFENLTPIERNVWSDIRANGLEYYPQFPIGKYYADFANPFTKIVIEVDGKVHTQSEVVDKDKEKDAYLKNKGWQVVRIEGWKTYRTREDYEYSWWELEQMSYVGDEIKYVKDKYWLDCSEGILLTVSGDRLDSTESEYSNKGLTNQNLFSYL